MGSGLLITNLCLTPDLLARAALQLIYGGYQSPENLSIEDFSLWPIEE